MLHYLGLLMIACALDCESCASIFLCSGPWNASPVALESSHSIEEATTERHMLLTKMSRDMKNSLCVYAIERIGVPVPILALTVYE